MILETFPGGPLETNTYILACPITRKACVVDVPPETCDWILDTVHRLSLELEKILLTHSHYDHIIDVPDLVSRTGVPVFIHRKDEGNLRNPGSDGIPFPVKNPKGLTSLSYVEEGDRVVIGNFSFEVLHTPGHTPGGVCYHLAQEAVLFSGDTLFRNSMGRVDLPTGVPQDMWKSLKRLATLPVATRVYPGHGPSTAIGREKDWMVRAEEHFS